MRDIIKNLDSMLSKLDGSAAKDGDKTLPLKLKENVKVKDFNVNINLNLRVLKDEKSSAASSGRTGLLQKQGLGIQRPAFEEKRKTSDSIKLIQEIKEKFNKKGQPTQIAPTKKGSIDREYKIGSELKVGVTGRRIEVSSKDAELQSSKTSTGLKTGLGHRPSMELSKESPTSAKLMNPNLKIKNFEKVRLADVGLEGF